MPLAAFPERSSRASHFKAKPFPASLFFASLSRRLAPLALDSLAPSIILRQMEDRPLALVTNDDGMDSPFLRVLVEALTLDFRIVVVAPLREQSWIGRAMSRRKELVAERRELSGQPGWVIDGTPSDCVNLALGHLLVERPAVVVSGLNIGYNAGLRLLLSSGTVAGAIEGAHWGIPSLAVSQALPAFSFQALAENRQKLPQGLLEIITASAEHATRVASSIAGEENNALLVHNLNYPENMSRESPVSETVPARVTHGPLFTESGEGRYQFRYRIGREEPAESLTDRMALRSGAVSWTRLNFSSLAASIHMVVPSSEPSS